MTVWFDANGLMVAQCFECTCQADYDVFALTFTLTDSGNINAMGGDVIMRSASRH